ncbi:MAG: putative Protein kinase [Anaerolineales bacterium]|nr:putative Protein kinase [Anaerolineales bacterium]
MLGLIGKTISHYTILEQIGQGGMSSVFSAVDLRDQRVVAVKVLSPYIAHEARFKARFDREIKLLVRLQHPNIMPILDYGEAEGLAFIIMPYIGTGTLGDRLLKGPLDPTVGSRIVQQLASALAAAHAAGVVHRDVKPSNVLVDPMGNALLSDFSFAHQTDASQNLTGSALIGTPAYMSPEQCRGEPIDARSDQYALAVVLYQIATGRLPFQADTPMATALKEGTRQGPGAALRLHSRTQRCLPGSAALCPRSGAAHQDPRRRPHDGHLQQVSERQAAAAPALARAVGAGRGALGIVRLSGRGRRHGDVLSGSAQWWSFCGAGGARCAGNGRCAADPQCTGGRDRSPAGRDANRRLRGGGPDPDGQRDTGAGARLGGRRPGGRLRGDGHAAPLYPLFPGVASGCDAHPRPGREPLAADSYAFADADGDLRPLADLRQHAGHPPASRSFGDNRGDRKCDLAGARAYKRLRDSKPGRPQRYDGADGGADEHSSPADQHESASADQHASTTTTNRPGPAG